jgi:hypothetical protein
MPIPTELFATIMAAITADSGSQPATDAIRVWHTLFRKVSPLLGSLSTDLLFARSLATHASEYPWLPRVAPTAPRTAFEEFARSLDARAAQDIVAVNHALLATYTTGLANLIGAGLTTRLLKAAFPNDKNNTNT